jgi:hypothetical protein
MEKNVITIGKRASLFPMPKSPRPWTVAPHDEIRKLEDNLWDVEGALPGMSIRRRMTIARRSDGRLVFFNAVPLRDEAMKAIEAFGEPAFLVVPNGGHKLDVHAFRARYPDMKVFSPAGARSKVSTVVQVDGALADMPADPWVSLEELDGTKSGDAVMTVRSGSVTTLVFADAFFNMPDGKGFGGMVQRLLGMTGGPKLTPIFRLFFLADGKTYAAHLNRLAETPKLDRLIVTHGDIVDSGGPEVLRKIAASA